MSLRARVYRGTADREVYLSIGRYSSGASQWGRTFLPLAPDLVPWRTATGVPVHIVIADAGLLVNELGVRG